MKWRFQRGDVPVGCIVGLVVLAIAALIGINAAPVMIHVGDLDSEIGSLADRSGRRDYKDDRIIRDILIKAEELDLPVTKKSIKIQRTRARFKIWVTYDVPIDFGVYTYVWHKEHFHDRPMF
jgi:hypothetical protein